VIEARRFLIRGTVQGVGFRPFVANLAATHGLAGWVLNSNDGVEIHVEGGTAAIQAFARGVESQMPRAAHIEGIDAADAPVDGFEAFAIRESDRRASPSVRISPDLPVCGPCLEELFDPGARRFHYPYINCTGCGPRFSIVRALPYDRGRTTMAAWPLCGQCQAEYHDPADRRFHAEPVACPQCGPSYRLLRPGGPDEPDRSPIATAAQLLRDGAIVAVKGIGGYHLACDARNQTAVAVLRMRKFRKSRPFAVMARDLEAARALVELDESGEALITSTARPIVLAPARVALPDIAPDHRELGVMLPYAPVHHLLFAVGAPDVIVMTSGNCANEPIAIDDATAVALLDGIADAFLVGGREIARRVDDSVVRAHATGPVTIRRGRGYAPAVVGRLSRADAVLAMGADLKNTITLVVDGAAMMSPHIGDLEHPAALESFRTMVRDFLEMYGVGWERVVVAHDLHPHYASTQCALELPAMSRVAVQHHRAHIASVLTEHDALHTPVVGVAFDGTGYGDDGTIWGGEFFVGSVAGGLSRVASLQPAALPGGDACARYPVQAAAGLLLDVDDVPDLTAPPFYFSKRYGQARRIARSGLRTFTSTSAGRLFDAAAALLGFTSEVEYEGQAAVWLEQLAWRASSCGPLPFALTDGTLDFRPALRAMAWRRRVGTEAPTLARAFHEAVAQGIAAVIRRLCDAHGVDTIVLSGGTFQNALLADLLRTELAPAGRVWMNGRVPANDGGLSLGQAALAAASLGSRDGGESHAAAIEKTPARL
jgi:hydrogenase maturation protein HypF